MDTQTLGLCWTVREPQTTETTVAQKTRDKIKKSVFLALQALKHWCHDEVQSTEVVRGGRGNCCLNQTLIHMSNNQVSPLQSNTVKWSNHVRTLRVHTMFNESNSPTRELVASLGLNGRDSDVPCTT